MATGEDSMSSVVKSSEEIFDTCCSPCSESGKIIEAVKFCVDCGSNFCGKCLQDHNKFLALRSHQILDKSGQAESEGKIEPGTGLPTERCTIHHGKLVDMFCKDHDEVCCAACIAIKHRSCINVDYLPDVAKGMNNCAELNETKNCLENVIAKMRQEIQAKSDNLKLLGDEKHQLFEKIEKLKTEILARVDELVEISKKQISLKYGDVSKQVQSDLEALNTGIATTTKSLQKLSEKNEAQLFVNIKTSKLLIKDCDGLLNELSTCKVSEELGFVLSCGLKDQLSNIDSLVIAVDNNVKEYKATVSGKYTINPNQCEITDICNMDDGTFVIADFTNSKLKRLNAQLKVTDHVSVGGNPFSVCKVGPNEVATYVTGRREILLVSVGQTMKTVSVIKVTNGSDPVGVCYDAKLNALLLCHISEVDVYNRSGYIIKTYEKNKNGEKVFTKATQVAINTTDQLIVTDQTENKVKAMTRDGEISWTFSDPALRGPWGVCILPGDIIIVSGLDSNNVFQVDKEGRKIGELLGASETLNQPFALAFDERNSRLLVGCSSNEIRVYTLSKV